MPKLSFLLPCRTFSTDAETGGFTIVEVLDQITINVPNGAPTNGEGVVPAPWAIVNLWTRQPDDKETQFEQRLTLVSPDGRTVMDNTSPFELKTLKHRMTLRVNGFPVVGRGLYLLRAETRALPGKEWKLQGEYPIEVIIS
jgi:hypothetical protein